MGVFRYHVSITGSKVTWYPWHPLTCGDKMWEMGVICLFGNDAG